MLPLTLTLPGALKVISARLIADPPPGSQLECIDQQEHVLVPHHDAFQNRMIAVLFLFCTFLSEDMPDRYRLVNPEPYIIYCFFLLFYSWAK